MHIDPSGQQALGTGRTAGNGFAAAFSLIRLSASVIVNRRTQARVARAMREIQDDVARVGLIGIAADLAMKHGVAHVIDT